MTVGDVDVDLDLPAYVAHPGRTAAEHVAELAKLGGALAFSDADGRLQVMARPSGPPSSALLYGREIIDYSSGDFETPNAQRFAIGSGPAGSASAPDALRPSLDVLPSSAADGGPGVLRCPVPMLRTPTAAADASTALQTANAARGRRLRARCFLLPALRPGDVVEVQSLPDGLAGGPWLLTRVVHELRPGSGGRTLLEADERRGLIAPVRSAGRRAVRRGRAPVSEGSRERRLLFDSISRIARHEACRAPGRRARARSRTSFPTTARCPTTRCSSSSATPGSCSPRARSPSGRWASRPSPPWTTSSSWSSPTATTRARRRRPALPPRPGAAEARGRPDRAAAARRRGVEPDLELRDRGDAARASTLTLPGDVIDRDRRGEVAPRRRRASSHARRRGRRARWTWPPEAP